ncbi:MAG: metal-dependent transcriptional regulator [Candidatus Omnitrophica bacterium]|nr:metal-dependent transcriptional regulator [Candidatus Omnitrophota bacterium]
MKGQLSSNIEDYLETIVILSNQNKAVRVKDIAKKMDVTMPSVHSALCILKAQKLINHQKYGYVELTEKGQIIGSKIYRVHKKLTEFLTEVLNIDDKVAEKDACELEHCISSKTLEKLVAFLEFLKVHQSSKNQNLICGFVKFLEKKRK